MKLQLSFILILIFGITISFNVFAQEKSSPADDFTLTDTDGNVENLYETLAEGKTVILYFFSCACGHCYTAAPIVDSIYKQFGSGEEQLEVWGIAHQVYNNEEIELFKDSTDITFPCFATGHATDVFGLYGIEYTPQVKIICNYLVSDAIATTQIIENLNYCFPTEIEINKIETPFISIKGDLISIETTKQINNVNIYDVTGRKIESIDRFKPNTISIKNLIHGNLYILNIIFADGTSHSEKLILQ